MVFGLLVAATVISSAPTPVLAGYLPAWAVERTPEQSYSLVTDVLYFSIQPEADGKLNLKDIELPQLDELAKKKAKHGFRLLLCVGGWGRSEHFAKVAADQGLRRVFVGELVKFADQHKLDGIDLDWEHPENEAESKSYAVLMKDLKAGLGPKRLVTAALAGWQSLPKEGWETLDRLHLMAYDRPKEHSTYEGALEDVASAVKQGMPLAKIAMGVPFYGRKIAAHNDSMTTAELMTKFKVKSSEDTVDGYYFNNVDTLTKKAKYARDNGLGGIMVWEMSQDLPGAPLMSALKKSLAR